jgi:hypothetical protein
MMTLTKGQVHDAVRMLKQIADRPRQIPQIAKFKLARMHDRLEPAFEGIEIDRQKLVQQHGNMVYQDAPANTVPLGWSLTEQSPGFAQFVKDWQVLRAQPAGEFKITPITLQMLGTEPNGLEVDEFGLLGALVVDAEESEDTRG